MLSPDDLQTSVGRAVQALIAQRNPEGYWEGRLASSPLATAVALCALAGEIGAYNPASAFAFLAQTQNKDGGWGDTEISKSNLAATLLVLSANTMHAPAGLSATQRQAAQEYTEKMGGLSEGLRRVYGSDLTFQVPIRMTAACAGLIPWSSVDALPFELALAPRGLMGALRLPVVSYALPALVCVGLARHAKAPSWFLPSRWLRSALTEKALNLILKMQPESGGYLEAIPITAFCMLGLKAAGRGDHAIVSNARKFLFGTQREDGAWPVEVHLSIWNTTRAIEALAAGDLLNSSLKEAERNVTRDWLLAQQTTGVSVYSDAKPGGWGWNHLSGSVPDVDDTSGAILALKVLGVPINHSALERGRQWLYSIQNNDGGWPTFCRGWGTLPFDRSAPDLTVHALRAVEPAKGEVAAWRYLRSKQRADGSFAPLWFGCESASDELNSTYGSTHFLFSFPECGYDAFKKEKDRCLDWLRSIQNPDGGFGGCKDAPSTAEETGLALRALVLSGVDPEESCCMRAAEWLIKNQRADGSWNPAPIGFYFAVLWYYEELYPLCYALGGLGALEAALNAGKSPNKTAGESVS